MASPETPDPLVGKIVSVYRITERLGSGSFATVYRAEHTITLTGVAMKAICKTSVASPDEFELLQREVKLMKGMDHPFVAFLYDVLDDDSYFYLVIELVDGGSLLTYIRYSQSLNEATARRIFYQIVSVLEYLHNDRHIAHRDIKPENVLLDRNLNIRVVDFGLARAFTRSNPFLDTTCGSPAYIAPEILQQKPYTAAADIWSAGILLYGVVAGRLPFYDQNIAVMLSNVMTMEPAIPPDLTPFLRRLLTRCLIKDPRLRITLQEIHEDPWLAEYEDSRLLSEDADMLQSLRIMIVDTLDDAILSEMKVYGYDTAGLLAEVRSGKVTARTAAYKMLKRERSIQEIHHWQTARAAKAETLMREGRIALEERPTVARSQEVSICRRDLRIPYIPRRVDQTSRRRVRVRAVVASTKRSESPKPTALAPLPELKP
jgi:serine/threonine protein kinase